MRKRYSRDQIMVLIGACLFQCAMLGVLVNSSGVIFAQIREELGFSMSKISVYNTLKSVTTALSAATMTAFFFRTNKARFLLVNQLTIILSFLMITIGAEGPLWYASALACGAASSLSSVAVPMLLARWFPENAGTTTGIAMSFSGIGGAVCNPLCAKLIDLCGWRWAVVILGAIMLAMTIPGLALMFRREAPPLAGSGGKAGKAQSGKESHSIGTVILVCVALAGGSIGVSFAVNISMFAQSVGYSLSVGASLTTMIMLGNLSGKFLYGLLCDKLGAWKATMLGMLVAAVAVLCFLFAQDKLTVLFGASLLFGCVYALCTVSVTRCCASAYGEQDSKHYLGIHTCVNSAVLAGMSLLAGVLYDYAQSFTPVLLVTLVAVACSFTAAAVMLVKTRKKAVSGAL